MLCANGLFRVLMLKWHCYIKKLNTCGDALIFYWEFYTLFVSTLDIGKNADFERVDTRESSVSVCFCVATIGVCVFRCVDSDWRTFLICEVILKIVLNKSL